jgi:hypothetical protein
MPSCTGFPRHRHARRGAVAQIIAIGQQVGLPRLDGRLCRLEALHDRRERLFDVDRRIAGGAALRLLLGKGGREDDQRSGGRQQQPGRFAPK